MPIKYIQLRNNEALPDLAVLVPYRAIVIVEDATSQARQEEISDLLVSTGCLYMMAWGVGCGTWDDSVDVSNLKANGYGDIPENRFVMTTWHEDESLEEVFEFSKLTAHHPRVNLENTLLLHLAETNREQEFLEKYGRT